MKVEIHTLFQYLLNTTEANPEVIVGLSLSEPPRLGDFLADLDPAMSLDWNSRSFRGLPELRQNVLARTVGTEACTPDDVLITAGAAEANYLAFTQLVQEGDEVVTERPGWPQAEVLAKAKGAVIRAVERDESNRWALSIDAIEAAVTPKTKLIFLTNPNNPTGKLLSHDDLVRLAGIAERVGAWLLVDEVYAGLEWQASRAPSIAGLYARGITTGSVSKALGLQGLRTGWMICRDADLIMDAVILRENSSEIMNVLGEVIAEIALRKDRYDTALARARETGLANLDRLDRFIRDTDGLSWVRPEAGLIGLARLEHGMGGDAFATRLLATPHRTFLLPGSSYDCPDHIRLGVGGDPMMLETGLARIATLLSTWERDQADQGESH